MKFHFFLVLLFLGMFKIATAQNWAPFPHNQKTWFEFSNDSHYSKSLYYSDSLEISADSTRYYFHLKYLMDKLSNLINGNQFSCLDTTSADQGLWLDYFEAQTEDFISIKHPFVEKQGVYYYKGNMVFNTLLKVGDRIPIYSDEFNIFDYLQIECIEQKLDTFFGKTDSIKIFSLTAIKDGQTTNSLFNDFEYVLSKNYGFIQFLPFLELLNVPKTTATIVGFEDDSNNLCGQNSIQQFLPYEVGDVLYWIKDAYALPYSSTIYYEDSITSVNIIEEQFSYSYNRVKISTNNGYYGSSLDTTISKNTKTFNLTDEVYQIFNHSIYGVDVIYDICTYNNNTNPRVINIELAEDPFSFNTQSNSYDLTYDCFGAFAISMDNSSSVCSAIELSKYVKSEFISCTFNSSLGLISNSSSFYRSSDNLKLIYYKKNGEEFKPGYELQNEYSVYDPPVKTQNCGFFFPYLTPDSLLNIPFEVNCSAGIWDFSHTLVVKGAGQGECELSNLVVTLDECNEENSFIINFTFDFIFEGNSNFMATLNGAVIDTFSYTYLHLNGSLSILERLNSNFCFEVTETENWELTLTDIEFPNCSISNNFLVPVNTLNCTPATGTFKCMD